MTHRLVHVGFMFPGVPKVRDLEPVFDKINPDWIRYSQTCWLLWTDKPVAEIFRMIVNSLDPLDNVFVSQLEGAEFVGRLPNWAWTWIRSKVTGVALASERPDLFAGVIPPPSQQDP